MDSVVDRVKRILMLDASAYTEVAEDESATGPAFAVAMVAALVSGIGTAFTTDGFGIGSALGAALIGAPLGLLIGSGVFFLLGKMFGGQGEYMGLLRAFGHASAPQALGIIPILGSFIGSIWSIVCAVIAVREIHKLSTGLSVVVVLIPVVVIGGLIALLLIALFAAFATSVS